MPTRRKFRAFAGSSRTTASHQGPTVVHRILPEQPANANRMGGWQWALFEAVREFSLAAAPDLVDYQWLVSDAARTWLEQAAHDSAATSLVTLSARLRRDLSAARTHLVLEQVRLRARAAEKFSLAAEMFFAPLALEQATDETISRYMAERFPDGAETADLCCGIGGDTLGLALRSTRLRLVDRQASLVLMAEANIQLYLAAAGRPAAVLSAEVADLDHLDWRPGPWHADPDRRPQGKRSTSVVDHEPPPETFERLLAEQPAGAIKLAPAARLPEGWRERAECEWISRRGECRQLVAWFGPLAQRPGEAVATILAPAGDWRRHVRGQQDLPSTLAERIGPYVYEPDAAVSAAGLVGALARQFGWHAVSERQGYLTGDQPVVDWAAAGFEVLDVLPLQLKKLQAYLRARGVGRVEVKKRCVECDPLKLQKQLGTSADGMASLLICRRGGKIIVIVARRLADSGALTDGDR